MALNLEAKKAIVEEVQGVASNALSAVVAEYRGLTVAEMTELRVQAREKGVWLKVVRNTLTRRAVEDTDFACLKDVLTGPLICAFASEEPGAAAKLLRDFAKTNDKLKVTALSIGGKLLDASQVDAVAKLPTKDEAIASLMSVMNGPITKLTRTLNEVPTKITRVIAAVRDQKQG